MSSSSATSRRRLTTNCKCGFPLVKRVSWTHLNPGMRFLNCPNSNISDKKKCNDFWWIDPEISCPWKGHLPLFVPIEANVARDGIVLGHALVLEPDSVKGGGIVLKPNGVGGVGIVLELDGVKGGGRIRGVLSQNHRHVAFFSEKVNEARHKYSTYDQESYAIVRTVEYWRHYLLPNEFILFSDHEALKFINGQHSLKPRHAKLVETLQAYSKPRHAKWVETLQAYSFVIWHKVVSANIVVDVLARRIVLLSAMNIQVYELNEADSKIFL
nr:putative nucleotidyltransferase, ribonuclease H [Tanacetum cinerariifolium]